MTIVMENAQIDGPEFHRHENINGARGSEMRNNQAAMEMITDHMSLPRQADGSISSNTNCQFNAYESVTSAYNTQEQLKDRVESSTVGKATSIT